MLTVHLNAASIVGSAFGFLTELKSSGSTSNGQRMSVNALANAALQIGAVLGGACLERQPSGRDQGSRFGSVFE